MVYETDFYTIRRPYTRPTITSYSVTGCRPCVWRTTTISPIGAHSKVRLSVLLGELNRIQNRPRMHLSYVPTEDFLNSRPLVEFDDETKYIRAEADKLMKYLYVSVPHQKLPPKITTSYDRLMGNGLVPYSRYGRNISNDILNMSYYYEPTRTTIGRGHLACISYAGGRGYPRRKHLFADEYRDIGDEIKVRSYYNKHMHHPNRLNEALALPTGFAYRLLTADRKPYITPEDERKTNATTKFKRNENLISKPTGEKLQKKEKFLDSDKDTINVEKSKVPDDTKVAKAEQKRMDNVEEAIEKKESKINKKIDKQPSEELIQYNEPRDIPDKLEKVTAAPSTEEKPKSKKESRRKLSEKLSEESTPSQEKVKEDIKPSTTPRKVSESKSAASEKPAEKTVASEKPVYTEKPVEKPVVAEKPADKSVASEVAAEEPIEHTVISEKPSLERTTSKTDAKKGEQKAATESAIEQIEKDIKEQTNVNSAKAEIPIETETISETKIEKVPVESSDKVALTEEVKKEDEKQEQEKKDVDKKQEVVSKDVETKEAETKAAEVKETETVQQDIKPKETDEQVLESTTPEIATEPKVESKQAVSDTPAIPQVDESSVNVKIENEPSITEVQEVTPVVESPKEETNIELNKKTIPDTEELVIEAAEIETTKESTISQDTAEPIVEEPVSPEGTTVPFPDQTITDQPTL